MCICLCFGCVVMRRNSDSELAAASVLCFWCASGAGGTHRAPIKNIWPEATHSCICLCFWYLFMLQSSALGDFSDFEVWLSVRLESNMCSQIANRQHMTGWKNRCLGSCFGFSSCGGVRFLKSQELPACNLLLVAGAFGRPQR